MAPWPWAKTKLIHKAVESGNVPKLNQLLKSKRLNVNAEDSNGATGLHLAAPLGNSAVLEALLAHDTINPNARGPNGKAPLHIAISAKSGSAVKALLEHRLIEVNLADDDGRTPLHYAVDTRNHHVVSLLINAPGVNYDAQDKHRRTPLAWALHVSDFNLAYSLISKRDFVTEVSVVDADGNTALHKAAKSKGMGGSIMARLAKGQTSAILDAKNTSRRRLGSETALQVAARSNNVDAFEQLVIAGASLSIGRSSDGATALHVAVQRHSWSVIKYMRRLDPPLRRTAISAKDNDGNTPLHLAAELRSYTTVDSVLELFVFSDPTTDGLPLRPDPVEVIRANDKGQTAVEFAALYGYAEITMRLLLAEEMAPKEVKSRRSEAISRILPKMLDDHQKTTAELLKWAVRGDVLDDFRSVWKDADTSLLERFIVLAAGAGHLHVVQYLVEEGVNPNTRLEHIGTPLGVAAAYGRVDVMRFLLSLGEIDANLGIPDEDTPLMSAIRSRSAAAMSVLLSDELVHSFRLSLNQGPSYLKDMNLASSNPLLLISELGYYDMAEMLVRRDYVDRVLIAIDVGSLGLWDCGDRTPLGRACEGGHWRVVELLLQAHSWTQGHDVVSIDAKDAFRMTPFSLACASPSSETIALFLKSDLFKRKLVDPNSKDNETMTPLASACKAGRVDNVKLLLGSYLLKDGLLEPDVRDTANEWTPLAHACVQGAWEIVQLFLDYCLRSTEELDLVDFRTVDKDGKSLLDLAAESSSAIKTVLVLLDSRLVDRGLVDPRKVYQSMSGRFTYYSHDNIDHPDMRQLVQRLEDLGCMGPDNPGAQQMLGA